MNGGAIFSEAWGTFLLVVVAAGAGVIGAQSGGEITLSMKVVAPGIMVMAIIYFMGAVGGAHLNPAVTLAFAARRNFPWAGSRDISRRRPAEASRRLASCGRCSAQQVYSAPRLPGRDLAIFRRL